MTDPEHQRITANEMAVEQQYADAVTARAKEYRRTINQMGPNTWTANPIVDIRTSGELIGRVALNAPNPTIDGAEDFYIGTAKHSGHDYEVFSWAAPIACTYYRKSREHHSLCDEVVGVRVFAHRGDHIVDFEDEAFDGDARADLFPTAELRVPRAPGRPTIALTPESAGSATSEDVPPEPASEVPTAAKSSTHATSVVIPGPPLRAPELLRRQLATPKTVAMSAVLATLQSDQYDAITKPASENQVLQGHPGTGKTIIAAHRAAYLLNAEVPAESRPRGRVLILGPTAEYVEHVQGALRKLIDDPEGYEVKSVPALLEELAGLPQSTVPTESVLWEDVSPDLARLVDLALAKAKTNLGAERPNAKDVYAELLWLLQDPPDEGLDGEWATYLRALPATFEELRRQRVSSYRGLMAYIGVRTSQTSHPGHIIVDEAQDVHPIEWEILGRLGNTGGWTILGDLNQRRTDHTFSSWDNVATLLAIEGDDGEAPVTSLERGYRSTAQIIKFANQLLPARERILFSLQQDGEVPTVQRAGAARDLYGMTFSAAAGLLERVGTGTVAVITVDPRSVSNLMVRAGWRADIGDVQTWRNGEQVLRLLTPERARGLEFDGVVVVEPADFPENFGRQGVLYTALTRANRLLTVVHHRALPRGIKIRS